MVPLGALAQVFGTVDAVGGAVSIIHEDGIQSPPVLGQKLLVGQTVFAERAMKQPWWVRKFPVTIQEPMTL